ncbi:hypothetical protein GCM10009678_84770 [Actinomadura kijaniata]|uniref:Uncharacterized protein n=1 Tax=Actinomadura namibiensis TaxID=182080 RepID=A0A7W3M0C2_ACTNM|nr:hypothetical protein [Actinomadura namibiensis]MBA8957646.1 hypothetical protein [Actinomadura namibiensis]
MDADWWSIEVFDGRFPATSWFLGWREQLVEAALTHGATDWCLTESHWGLVLELSFPGEEHWSRWRALPLVRAALDAVPDPVDGLLVYPGARRVVGRPGAAPPPPGPRRGGPHGGRPGGGAPVPSRHGRRLTGCSSATSG